MTDDIVTRLETRLRDLESVQANGDIIESPDRAAVTTAEQILRGWPAVPVLPRLYPLAEGGVMIDGSTSGGHMLEVEVTNSGCISVFDSRMSREESDAAVFDSGEVSAAVAEIGRWDSS